MTGCAYRAGERMPPARPGRTSCRVESGLPPVPGDLSPKRHHGSGFGRAHVVETLKRHQPKTRMGRGDRNTVQPATRL
jgi:hypothetical protein